MKNIFIYILKFYFDKDLFLMYVNVVRLNCCDSDDLLKGKNLDVN